MITNVSVLASRSSSAGKSSSTMYSVDDDGADVGAGVATGMSNSVVTTMLLAYASLPSGTMYATKRYVTELSSGRNWLPIVIVIS